MMMLMVPPARLEARTLLDPSSLGLENTWAPLPPIPPAHARYAGEQPHSASGACSWGLGFGGWDLRFGVWGIGCRVWGVGLMVEG